MDKGSYSQSYGFPSSHVWMGELDHKVEWTPKNLCLHTVVWRRLLRVCWTPRRSNLSILKDIKPEYSLEGLMLKLHYFHHLMWRADSLEKTLMLGKVKGKRIRGWHRMRWLGWHHWLNGHESEQTQGDSEGQENLTCYSSWGQKELDMT